MTSETIIRFDGISVTRGGKKILDRVSFEVKAGEKVALLGPSGAGKSSVLMTLAGVLVPEEGTVFFNGTPLDSRTVGEVRRSIGFVGQEPVLGADTVRESLMLPFSYRANLHQSPDEEKVARTLKSLSLSEEILDKRTTVISGGEKQRVALARALLLGKRVFLADEVTSALDPGSKRAVLRIFEGPEITVLSVSHDPDWLAECQRVLEMDGGRLVETEENRWKR